MDLWQEKEVARLLEREEALTEWEHGFLMNIADFPRERKLSQKQKEALNRIIDKVEFR